MKINIVFLYYIYPFV